MEGKGGRTWATGTPISLASASSISCGLRTLVVDISSSLCLSSSSRSCLASASSIVCALPLRLLSPPAPFLWAARSSLSRFSLRAFERAMSSSEGFFERVARRSSSDRASQRASMASDSAAVNEA